MRTADGAEHLNQDVQATDRRQGVGQQRQGHVAAGQLLGHDPRSDHDGQQQHGADGLAGQLAQQVHHQPAAMSARARCSSALSMVSSGNCSSCNIR